MNHMLQRWRSALPVKRETRQQDLNQADIWAAAQNLDVRRGLINWSSLRWVVGAMLAFAFYFLFWASDRFVTEVQVYVQSSNETSPTLSASASCWLPPVPPNIALADNVGDVSLEDCT